MSNRRVVPRSAVQNVADRTVVYLVEPKQPGRFVEREVRLGTPAGDQVPVLAGVRPGDVVVSGGSFYVRAERERLGLRQAPVPAPPVWAESSGVSDRRRPATQTARITVGDEGYQPEKVRLRAGVPARVTFVRTSATTCATEVAFPSMNIKRALPLNEPVVVEFTPTKPGGIAFTCGVGMLKGTVVVQ